jgi:dTDP-4-amino-4,6-dideoxygalactose transaminase
VTARPRLPLFAVPHTAADAEVLAPVLASGQLAGGPLVAAFEAKLAQAQSAPSAIATSDASGALALALRVAGVRAGDEVALAPMVCAATAMPVAAIGARPRWLDVDPATGMPGAAELRAGIGPQTRAVVIYHWSGDVADLSSLAAVCRERGLPLIQDASEAWGASYRDRPLGAAGADATVLSFYATRVLSTGDGGALLVEDPAWDERARRLRRFGIDPKSFRTSSGDLNPASDIPEASGNLQMVSLAAALGIRQLADAENRVRRHQRHGAFFDAALRDVSGVTVLHRPTERRSSYWTYAFRAGNRAGLIRKLTERGIASQRLHLRVDTYGCFAEFRRDGLDGVALFDRENVAVPCGWWLSDADCEEIAACLRSGW